MTSWGNATEDFSIIALNWFGEYQSFSFMVNGRTVLSKGKNQNDTQSWATEESKQRRNETMIFNDRKKKISTDWQLRSFCPACSKFPWWNACWLPVTWQLAGRLCRDGNVDINILKEVSFTSSRRFRFVRIVMPEFVSLRWQCWLYLLEEAVSSFSYH